MTPPPAIRLARNNSLDEINKALRDIQDAVFARRNPRAVPCVFASQTADLNVTGSYLPVPGLTTQVTAPGSWLITTALVVFSPGTTSSINVQLCFRGLVPGTPAVNGNVQFSVAAQWLVESISGNETIQIQAANFGAGSPVITGWGTVSGLLVDVG